MYEVLNHSSESYTLQRHHEQQFGRASWIDSDVGDEQLNDVACNATSWCITMKLINFKLCRKTMWCNTVWDITIYLALQRMWLWMQSFRCCCGCWFDFWGHAMMRIDMRSRSGQISRQWRRQRHSLMASRHHRGCWLLSNRRRFRSGTLPNDSTGSTLSSLELFVKPGNHLSLSKRSSAALGLNKWRQYLHQ